MKWYWWVVIAIAVYGASQNIETTYPDYTKAGGIQYG